jgi:glycosyltransferase involved in cell wall biosynthesis
LVRFVLHARALRRALVDVRPDVVHAHDSDALGPAAAAARQLGVPFIYDAHELWLGRPPRDRGALYRFVYRLWYRRLERRELPRAAAIITVSPAIAIHLERTYGLGDVGLVPNYPERASPAGHRDVRELAMGGPIPMDAPVVLHLGGYLPDRGLEQLVAAIALGNAHLVLLGIPPHRSPLDAMADRLGIASRVHFVSPVASDDVVSLAASATLGVAPILPTTPNNAASLPNKVFQYMAAGLPVVASDLPQLRTIVEGSGAGRCVDSSDPQALSAAIGTIVGDAALAASMGRAARAAVEQRYHWGIAAATLLDVYARVASPRPLQSGR